MTTQDSTIQLFKIIVGVAWIDGRVQPEEQGYLTRLAQNRGIGSHPAIYPLLNNLKKVTKDECYQWISDYLGTNPQPEKLNHLIEEISGLIYSDGEMDSAEAEVLTNIQNMTASAELPQSLNAKIIEKIQSYYQKVVLLQNP